MLGIFITSCSDEVSDSIEIESEKILVEKLNLQHQNLTLKEKENIKEITNPIYFDNIEDAKEFFNARISFSKVNFYKDFMLKKSEINKYPLFLSDGDNWLLMSCPPTILDPVEKCGRNDGGQKGCGSGTANFSVRQNGVLNYNVALNYNSSSGKVEADGVNSYISGFTPGNSWTQESTRTNVNGSRIDFEVQGTLNFNVIVEGIGTVFKRRTIIRGSYDPCDSGNDSNNGIFDFLQE